MNENTDIMAVITADGVSLYNMAAVTSQTMTNTEMTRKKIININGITLMSRVRINPLS